MTPSQLANVFKRAGDLHEESYNHETYAYTMDWNTAIGLALFEQGLSNEYQLPLYIAIQTEYVDIWDWVDTTLKVPA